MTRLTRRRLMVTTGCLGAGTALLGTPAFLRSSLAQPAGAPKRFMTLFLPNSVIRARWVSQGGRDVDAGTGDATQFTRGALAEPLAPVQPQMTLIHGTYMREVQGDQHSSAQIRVTTGADVDMPNEGGGGGNLPTAPSIDTLAAEESPLIRAADVPFKQLVMSADTRGPSLHHRCISSDMSNAFIAPDNEPRVVFDRLFADASTATSSEERQRALEQLKLRKRSVLDFLTSDLQRLDQRIPAAQRPKLESHLSAVRALETALERQTSTGVTIELPSGLEALQPNRSANHPQVVQGFLDITKAAFQLDLTRVVSLSFGTGNSAVSFADFGDGPEGGVHDIAHQNQNTDTQDRLSAITVWYLERVTEFVQALAAIPEEDGTMLDNTLIFLFSEVGQWHEHEDIPMALIGGKNLGHVGGRCLRYDRHVNDVGMALVQALGIPRTSFGDERWLQGAAPELFG